MDEHLNKKIDRIFDEIGGFGPYQLFVFIIVGMVAFTPSIVSYSFSFYGAVPNHRCQIIGLANDTYEIADEIHLKLVEKFIPPPKSKAFTADYDKCNIKVYAGNDSDAYTLEKCNKWVYSKKYFGETLGSKWDLVCQHAPKRTMFNTFYFVGTYGVILNGILSDRFGRKVTMYGYIIANSILNISLAVLLGTQSLETNIKQILFVTLRFFCGLCANLYGVSVVMATEVCGSRHRVTAANTMYYMFILGQFIVLLVAYFVRDFAHQYAIYAALLSSFLFLYWMVPESPRWLMSKGRTNEAYKVFQKIAKANKKQLSSLIELENLKQAKKIDHEGDFDQIESTAQSETKRNYTLKDTVKIFFKTKKLFLGSIVLLVNWLTNTLVYYGISYNTSDLVGDPYLNFFFSALVELIAVGSSHFLLERFGRKRPYAVSMVISGTALLLVQFVSYKTPILITVLALIAKFAISFTYTGIYIITVETYPTVIRNSIVSMCVTFGRIGNVLGPNIQLLGELYWFPLPFILYGAFSTISAITFILFISETKNKKLPDSLEDFIDSL